MKTTISNKQRVIKAWHYTLDYEGYFNGSVIPEDGCVLIPMRGYSRLEDFYLCVPEHGFYFRSANCSRYGVGKLQYFIDGEFVGAGWEYKADKIKALYEAGEVFEAKLYIRGYMLWRETTLGGRKINERKEAARISHVLCEESGRAGHDARQYIRRQILNGTFNY